METTNKCRLRSPSTAYAFFLKEARPRLTKENPKMRLAESGRFLRAMWLAMSKAEKEAFQIKVQATDVNGAVSASLTAGQNEHKVVESPPSARNELPPSARKELPPSARKESPLLARKELPPLERKESPPLPRKESPFTWVENRLAAYKRYNGCPGLSSQICTMLNILTGKEHELVDAILDSAWEAVLKVEEWLNIQSRDTQSSFVSVAEAVEAQAQQESKENPGWKGLVKTVAGLRWFVSHLQTCLLETPESKANDKKAKTSTPRGDRTKPDESGDDEDTETQPGDWLETRLKAFGRYVTCTCLPWQIARMFDLVEAKDQKSVEAHSLEPWEAVLKAEEWLLHQSPVMQAEFVHAAETVTEQASREVAGNPALQGLRHSLAGQRLFVEHLKKCLPTARKVEMMPTLQTAEVKITQMAEVTTTQMAEVKTNWVENCFRAFERYAGARCLPLQLSIML